MRLLTIVAALALLLVGPILYVGPGAAARAERRDELEKLEAQRRDLESNLNESGKPPSLKALAQMRQELDRRRADREAILTRLFAFRDLGIPTDVELRRAGETGRLTAPLLEPLLAAMPEGAAGVARRHTLLSVFKALTAATADPPANVTALRVARETTSAGPETGLLVLRVDLEASGPPTAIALLVESLLATVDGEPVRDLVKLELAPDPQNALAVDLLPMTLVLAFDVIVGEGS